MAWRLPVLWPAMSGVETAAPSDEVDPKSGRRNRWKTALWVLFVLVIVSIVAFALFMRVSVRRAFPQTDGTIEVPGLASDVEVIRDSMGVPHIYADTVEDLFLAQGYVHAQDRFYQMDFWRHISFGRLSEMFGSSQTDTDRFLRTMGWGALSEDQYRLESLEMRRILDSYASGVNEYLATRSPSDLAFEYTILEVLNHGYTPEEWKPAESLAWGKVMSWDLGGNMAAEIGRAMALGTLPADRVNQLYPPYPGDRHPFIIPEGSRAAQGAEAAFEVPPGALSELADARTAIEALNDLTGGGAVGIGSNSWAVSGQHTPTGAPMLMNDPHLGIQMPSIWYQVGLHCRVVSPDCPFDVAGFSFAGVPGVIIGHNAKIAWGFTNTGPDVQDLYIEKINPDNRLQYEHRGEWLDMDVRTEVIEVAGGDDITLEVRTTIHGPIISDVYEPLEDFDESGTDKPSSYALSLRWTALDDVPSIASPIMGLNIASNFEDFREAALLFSVPSQNLLYADVEGNIGYQMPGNIPIRSRGDGTAPVPGWSGEYEWTGFIPYEQLPYSYNPDSGFIITANNAVIDEAYPYLITEDWAYGYRARRIVDLVTSNPQIGLSEHGLIQFDGYDLSAEYLRPYVLDAIAAVTPDLDETARDALDAMTAWDLQNFADRSGAAVWNATWAHMLALTFRDELAEDYWPEGGSRWFEVVRGMVDDPSDTFWDDASTPSVETRDDILAAAFTGAVAELSGDLGSRVDDWTWGEIHTATFENATIGSSGIGIIDDRLNRGPYPASGSESVPNAVGWDATEDAYEVDWLPSMRMLVDLGDLTASLAVHTTGQSGHTDHPHYDDMIPIWLAGDNVPMLWDRADIEADAEAILVLTP